MARERTQEFFSTIKSIEAKPQYMNSELRSRRQQNQKWTNGSVGQSLQSGPHYKSYVQFMRGSRSVARDLFATYQKLEKINVLAQKKTIFDGEEASRELNELVYIVKQDITSLNQQIEQLRQQQQMQQQKNAANIESHSKNVVLTLQHQLASISNNFKNTLQLRTQNMAQQKLRREQFTTSPAAVQSKNHSTVIDFSDEYAHSSSSNGHNSNNNGDYHDDQRLQEKQLLIYEDQSNDYLEERTNTMQSIESTIVELGTIFNQLATMVQQQEEMITRIDANVTDTALNVEAAHQSLLQYFSSVTNNRWLILKVFGILFAFFILFVVLIS
ncbi:syntaxin-5-like [Oppia nitens]|uniref:syntaxin-5-like n=1 Tax=Oppia nitens TaxID=1686743 RepID=UPI0023DB2A30|nr:syntaxin-5-like [Oppia nitens]